MPKQASGEAKANAQAGECDALQFFPFFPQRSWYLEYWHGTEAAAPPSGLRWWCRLRLGVSLCSGFAVFAMRPFTAAQSHLKRPALPHARRARSIGGL